jgi:protein-S-isoprenylcysteine O-methyltransferase Ste14
MPMTKKAEPELVTSGPYRFVRHPIYSGILLGLLGTALAINLYLLIAFGAGLAYCVYSARVEERWLTASFPSAYPAYRTHTKMLIPFVL